MTPQDARNFVGQGEDPLERRPPQSLKWPSPKRDEAPREQVSYLSASEDVQNLREQAENLKKRCPLHARERASPHRKGTPREQGRSLFTHRLVRTVRTIEDRRRLHRSGIHSNYGSGRARGVTTLQWRSLRANWKAGG